MPLQARLWLECLVNDNISGIRIKKNIHKQIGFNFKSNWLGLHGPDITDSGNVIAGTSYAMGFAVDEGKNWFDDLFFQKNYFNIGLPVGPIQWSNLLLKYTNKKLDSLIFLYFPNVFAHAFQYTDMHMLGLSAFHYFKWETDYNMCQKKCIQFKQKIKNDLIYHKRENLFFSDKKYHLNYNYGKYENCKFSCAENDVLNAFKVFFSNFPSVKIFRIPSKEQVAGNSINPFRQLMIKRLEADWCLFRSCNGNSRCDFIDLVNYFSLEDYHCFDTHLNETGNIKLRNYIKKYL